MISISIFGQRRVSGSFMQGLQKLLVDSLDYILSWKCAMILKFISLMPPKPSHGKHIHNCLTEWLPFQQSVFGV
jgi:hypothetical protein